MFLCEEGTLRKRTKGHSLLSSTKLRRRTLKQTDENPNKSKTLPARHTQMRNKTKRLLSQCKSKSCSQRRQGRTQIWQTTKMLQRRQKEEGKKCPKTYLIAAQSGDSHLDSTQFAQKRVRVGGTRSFTVSGPTPMNTKSEYEGTKHQQERALEHRPRRRAQNSRKRVPESGGPKASP